MLYYSLEQILVQLVLCIYGVNLYAKVLIQLYV